MKKLLTFIGTRPEIIKMSSLIPEFDRLFQHVFVDSGQHYSEKMHAAFLEELRLRQPDYSLRVGSHRPAMQIGLMLDRLEEVFIRERPDAIVVHGDTNTTLAGALVASRYRHAPVALVHVEAGARSFNRAQPEEMNRRVVDQLSDVLFAPYEKDRHNLIAEGIESERVSVVGNTVVDSCRRVAASLNGFSEASQYGLQPGRFVLATFHRQETVDDTIQLRAVCDALRTISESMPVIVPLHPRTRKMLQENAIGLASDRLRLVEPLGYRSTVSLLRDCYICLTDSGGVQEEAAVLGTPALILRDNTEHMRYVESGMHLIVGTDRDRIVRETEFLIRDADEYATRKGGTVGFAHDTTSRIVDTICEFLR